MKLQPSERAWAPRNNPDLLLVLPSGHQPAKDRDLFLMEQADLLSRLVKEASPEEIAEANNQLRDRLPPEEKLWLPLNLLENPRTPRALMGNPASEGSRLHEWKAEARQARMDEPMEQVEADKLASSLNLETFLSRFL